MRSRLLPQLATALLAAALLACGPSTKKVWYRDDIAHQAFMRDSYDCSREVNDQMRGSFIFGGGVGFLIMQGKQDERARTLYAQCMGSRGYEVRRVPEAEAPEWQRVKE